MISNQILLKPSSIARVLGAVGFLLVLASIGGDLWAYLIFGKIYISWFSKLFWVDLEGNIPTYFSQLLMLFAALLLAVIAVLKRKQMAPQVLHWAVLTLGFLLMAADEAFYIHERLIKPMREMVGTDNLGVFYFAWVIPGIILVLVLALFFLKFLLSLPAKTKLTFLIAATLYISGAIGFEMIGGRYFELHGYTNLTYRVITNVEEGLEMAGLIFFIWGLLVYIKDNFKEVRLQF